MPYIHITQFVNNGIVYMTNFGNDFTMNDKMMENEPELQPLTTNTVNNNMNQINQFTDNIFTTIENSKFHPDTFHLNPMNELPSLQTISTQQKNEENTKETKEELYPFEQDEEELFEFLQRTAIGNQFDDDNIESEIALLKRKIDIFSANISLYDELIKQEELKRVIGTGMDEGWIDTLKQWTGYSNCKVIYDSETNELSGDMLFLSLRLVSTVTFIIETTDGDIFGSYHTIIPTKQNCFVANDPHHFLFTLKNKLNTSHEQFKVFSQNNRLLDIFAGKDSWVMGVNNGFWIHSKPNRCFITSSAANGDMHDGYYDPKKYTSKIFTGSVYPKRFTLKRLIALEFYPNDNE